MAMLEVKNLEVYYGVIQAIKGISFEGISRCTFLSVPFSSF